MTPAECPVCAPPGVSVIVVQPPMVTSPAGPTVVSPGFTQTIDGIGELFVGAADNSGGVHAREEPVAPGC